MNVAKLAKRGLCLAGALSISAASAFAQSLLTVPYEEGFSQWSDGLVYGQNQAGWNVNADDASYITNNLAGYANLENVLALNTEGQTLEAKFDQTGTGTDNATLWVDALVKMVVSEDDPASISNDVRTAVFLNASSNLVIYHGVVIADPESGSNIIVPTNTVTDVEINPDSFCRLTIEVNGDSEGTGQFFKFYIDGDVVEAPAAGIAYAEIPDNIEDTASNGVWFASARATTGNCFVKSLAFQGTGYVDDISVKRDSPLTAKWQLNVAATSNGSITTNGVALAEGSYDIDTRASITLVATPTNGYAVASFTTNGVAVGASSVVFADMAAEAEVTVAATFALQPAAVVDANGDIVAYYDSVAAAVAAADGKTVKLFAELDLTGANPNLVIPADITTTLDLNGFSIRGDNDADIQVLGDLTFMDSATYGENDTPASLYSTTAYASGHATGLVKVSGTGSFTMESGVIDAAKFLDPANEGQFAVVYFDEATVTINGGTIKAGWYALSSNGTVTNGQSNQTTVVVTGGSLISTSDYAIYMADAGSVTISGDDTVVDGAAGAICTRRGTLNISGGQFATAGTGDVGTWGDGTGGLTPNVLINVPANYAAKYGDQACAVTISGGDFTAAQGIACLSLGNDTVGSIAVSGGTFSAAIPEAYCAEGFVPVENGDGTYGVVEADYVAQIGNVKYESLAAAVAAAQSGDTVMLLTNVTLTARVEPNLGANTTLTIDLGGNTITREGTSGNGSAFDVKSGSVVITNGVIDCTQDDTAIVADGVYAITSRSGSDVTLAGLTITVDSECGACAYPFAGSTLTIKSGTYSNVTTTPYRYKPAWTGMAVNQPNDATQALIIQGGTFSQVDPRLGDDAGQMTSFVDAGYISVAGADGFSIVPGATITYVSDHGTAPAAKDVAFVNGSYTLVAADLPDLSDEGWTFDGWDKEIGDVISANTTITASWTEVVTPSYPHSAVAGDYVIVDQADDAEADQLTFGSPVAGNGTLTVPFDATIIGTGTVNSGLYLKVKTELAGAYSTIPAVVTLDEEAGEGTATFTPPAGATQLFFFAITDKPIDAGE